MAKGHEAKINCVVHLVWDRKISVKSATCYLEHVAHTTWNIESGKIFLSYLHVSYFLCYFTKIKLKLKLFAQLAPIDTDIASGDQCLHPCIILKVDWIYNCYIVRNFWSAWYTLWKLTWLRGSWIDDHILLFAEQPWGSLLGCFWNTPQRCLWKLCVCQCQWSTAASTATPTRDMCSSGRALWTEVDQLNVPKKNVLVLVTSRKQTSLFLQSMYPLTSRC